MFEEEPSTLKDKLIRFVVGLFLFLLVGMLVITFLPGDAEQSFLGAITGESSTKAGSIGGKTIPVDYFNAARRDCYYNYQRYGREVAGNSELILSCAFSTVKELYVARDIAEAVGFHVSEISIKRQLSEQARQAHKEAKNQAGYGEEDSRTVEEIYQQILVSVPMHYRVDYATGFSLFPVFIDQPLNPSPKELELKKEATQTKVSFRVLSFTEVDLLNQLENKIQVTEDELKKEFEKESKESKDKTITLESRRIVLTSKIKFDKKRAELEIWKKNLASKISQENALEAISKEVGSAIESIPFSFLKDLNSLKSSSNKEYRLGTDTKFWEELARDPFGKKRVAGPFADGDKLVYVEFGDLIFESSLPIKKEETDSENGKQLSGFFYEISQALGSEYGIEKQKTLSAD